MKYFLTLITSLYLLSCATLKKEDIPDASKQVVEELSVKPGYEVFLTRIDIFRQQKREEYTATENGKQVTKKRTVPVDYHYIGVDLGNGLFLDANLNLSLNLLKIAKLENSKSFKIVKKGMNILSPKTTYIKNDNEVTIKYGGLFNSDTNIQLRNNGATFKGGFLEKNQDINVLADRIVYDPHALLGDWMKTEVVKTEAGAKIPGFWQDKEITLSENKIELPSNFTVRKDGKNLKLIYDRFFSTTEFTYLRSDDRIMIFDEKMRGVQIDISDSTIKVHYASLSGVEDHEFEIVSK